MRPKANVRDAKEGQKVRKVEVPKEGDENHGQKRERGGKSRPFRNVSGVGLFQTGMAVKLKKNVRDLPAVGGRPENSRKPYRRQRRNGKKTKVRI